MLAYPRFLGNTGELGVLRLACLDQNLCIYIMTRLVSSKLAYPEWYSWKTRIPKIKDTV